MQNQSLPTSPAAHDPTSLDTAIPTIRRSIILISLPFGILGFVLPIYGKALGASAVEIGLFFSVFFLMLVILRPVIGAGLDRFGRRPFFIAGLFGYVSAMLAFAFSNQTTGILLARTLQGVASACLWLAAQAITADRSSADARGQTFGGVTQSSTQGAILGAFLGFGLLVPLGILAGWKPLFLIYAGVGFIAALLAWRYLKETNPGTLHSDRLPIRWSRTWIMLLLVAAVTGAAWAMLEPVMMIFLQERLTTEITLLALATLPSALVWALLPARLGRLADRFGRKPLMILGMSAAALTSFMIPGLNSLAALAALWAFQALCYAAGDPAEQALVADLTGGDQRGRAYGLYSMAAGLGAMFGPLVGGWLYQSVGQAAPFYANGLILTACALAVMFFLREPAARQTAKSPG
jgi:MFS transporter, DHA1 family, multidrug resistance protein